MKILILVLSLWNDDIYREFYYAQKETWDSIEEENVDTFYYFGNSDIDVIKDDKIFLTVDESLYNCGLKTLKCFDLVKSMEFDYIFRTNSSSYVDKQLLKEWLKNKPRNNFYSGIIGTHENINFASGSGYILSRDVFNTIIENQDMWEHDKYIDDVSLSLLLQKFNIPITNSERYDVIDDNIPINFFHYRLMTPTNRLIDIENMKKINKLKNPEKWKK
jgi:hypothetical protein